MGAIAGWIDLRGLHSPPNGDEQAVANGIACDAVGDRLFVAGKRWPRVFEIRLRRQ